MNNVKKGELSCILTHDKKVFWTQQRIPKGIFQLPYDIWEKPKAEWVKVERGRKDGQTAKLRGVKIYSLYSTIAVLI